MKAVYLSASIPYTDEMRKEFHGCRVENADAFQGVHSAIKTAIIIGDFPEIEKALKKADPKVDVEVRPAPSKDAKAGPSPSKGAESIDKNVKAGAASDNKSPKPNANAA